MKNFLLSVAVLFLFCCESCTKSGSNSTILQGDALFVNGCVGATNVGVTANGTSEATNMSMGATNNLYASFPQGSITVDFLQGTNSLISQGIGISSNAHTTVFLSGSASKPVITYTNDVLLVSPDSAELRFVNLSPDTLNLMGFFGSISIGSGIISTQNYNVSGFYIVPTGAQNILIEDTTKKAQATLPSQGLTAGHIYTLLFTGTKYGSGSSAYQLTLLDNIALVK